MFATPIERRYRRRMKTTLVFLALLLLPVRSAVWADSSGGELGLATEPKDKLKPGLDAITPEGMLAHIKTLSSDEFEGRAPGSKGEELSIKYIAEQFKKVGLKPGNPNGSFFQEVPLAGIKSDSHITFTVAGKPPMDLKFPDDFVASSARLQDKIDISNSDVVFVGYGIVAPEYCVGHAGGNPVRRERRAKHRAR